jgi:hypothetical protein
MTPTKLSEGSALCWRLSRRRDCRRPDFSAAPPKSSKRCNGASSAPMIRYDRDSPRAVDRGWPKAGFALTESAYRSAPARRFVESAPRCRPASCRSVSAYRSAVTVVPPPPADPPNPPPPTADSPNPPPPADLPPPESVALESRPQCPELTPPPPPAPTRRDRAKRKQAAVQDIAHRAFPPKGEVPPNISTARFKRDHVDPSWEVVAPTYGLAGSLPPDWHTVSRAISREL